MADETALADALHRAKVAGRLAEQARQDMMTRSRQRQEAIADAHRHASVRQIAAGLGCSPTVVHAALRAAARSRDATAPATVPD